MLHDANHYASLAAVPLKTRMLGAREDKGRVVTPSIFQTSVDSGTGQEEQPAQCNGGNVFFVFSISEALAT